MLDTLSGYPMTSEIDGAWKGLLTKRKRYQIVLTVRGRKITKEYSDKEDFRVWKEIYEGCKAKSENGIEGIETRTIYK